MRILVTILLLLVISCGCFAVDSFKTAPDSLEWFRWANGANGQPEGPYLLYSSDHGGPKDLHIKFNLEYSQSVTFDVVDLLGRQIMNHHWTSVLDQTYRIELPESPNRIFIVRLFIENKYYANKIYISK
jgi:hypothetical protein